MNIVKKLSLNSICAIFILLISTTQANAAPGSNWSFDNIFKTAHDMTCKFHWFSFCQSNTESKQDKPTPTAPIKVGTGVYTTQPTITATTMGDNVWFTMDSDLKSAKDYEGSSLWITHINKSEDSQYIELEYPVEISDVEYYGEKAAYYLNLYKDPLDDNSEDLFTKVIGKKNLFSQYGPTYYKLRFSVISANRNIIADYDSSDDDSSDFLIKSVVAQWVNNKEFDPATIKGLSDYIDTNKDKFIQEMGSRLAKENLEDIAFHIGRNNFNLFKSKDITNHLKGLDQKEITTFTTALNEHKARVKTRRGPIVGSEKPTDNQFKYLETTIAGVSLAKVIWKYLQAMDNVQEPKLPQLDYKEYENLEPFSAYNKQEQLTNSTVPSLMRISDYGIDIDELNYYQKGDKKYAISSSRITLDSDIYPSEFILEQTDDGAYYIDKDNDSIFYYRHLVKNQKQEVLLLSAVLPLEKGKGTAHFWDYAQDGRLLHYANYKTNKKHKVTDQYDISKIEEKIRANRPEKSITYQYLNIDKKPYLGRLVFQPGETLFQHVSDWLASWLYTDMDHNEDTAYITYDWDKENTPIYDPSSDNGEKLKHLLSTRNDCSNKNLYCHKIDGHDKGDDYIAVIPERIGVKNASDPFTTKQVIGFTVNNRLVELLLDDGKQVAIPGDPKGQVYDRVIVGNAQPIVRAEVDENTSSYGAFILNSNSNSKPKLQKAETLDKNDGKNYYFFEKHIYTAVAEDSSGNNDDSDVRLVFEQSPATYYWYTKGSEYIYEHNPRYIASDYAQADKIDNQHIKTFHQTISNLGYYINDKSDKHNIAMSITPITRAGGGCLTCIKKSSHKYEESKQSEPRKNLNSRTSNFGGNKSRSGQDQQIKVLTHAKKDERGTLCRGNYDAGSFRYYDDQMSAKRESEEAFVKNMYKEGKSVGCFTIMWESTKVKDAIGNNNGSSNDSTIMWDSTKVKDAIGNSNGSINDSSSMVSKDGMTNDLHYPDRVTDYIKQSQDDVDVEQYIAVDCEANSTTELVRTGFTGDMYGDNISACKFPSANHHITIFFAVDNTENTLSYAGLFSNYNATEGFSDLTPYGNSGVTYRVKDASAMFENNPYLEYVEMNADNFVNISKMFEDSNLGTDTHPYVTVGDNSNIEEWKVTNVTNVNSTFKNAKNVALDLSGWKKHLNTQTYDFECKDFAKDSGFKGDPDYENVDDELGVDFYWKKMPFNKNFYKDNCMKLSISG